MKKKFTGKHWEEALAKVFTKAISDERYRQLCVTDPRAAVAEVEPELELPLDFLFQFAGRDIDVIFSYLLPPLLSRQTETHHYLRELVEQNVSTLTHPPTPSYTPLSTSSCPPPGGGNPQ